jgi:hypothetical protein
MCPWPMDDWLHPVREALDAAVAPVDVFFRDDDAGWGNGRLLDLLDAFADRCVVVDVAVIPAALEPWLAGELRDRAELGEVRLHQHGYAHVNHEPAGRKSEFGPSRRRVAQAGDIAAGRERLGELLEDVVDPIFTPPWNRCTAETAACLAELGFAALSRESRAAPLGIAGLRELPVHVDWVRLPPTREGLGARLADAFRRGVPAGVMVHHAVMDRADLRRAGELLTLVADHPGARPSTMASLLGLA